jgi:hypothetical protein
MMFEARLTKTPPATFNMQMNEELAVSIRRVDVDGDRAIDRLARLDSRRLPTGPWLAAERGGEPLAAISLATRELVADPFARTAELGELLELRARQLGG